MSLAYRLSRHFVVLLFVGSSMDAHAQDAAAVQALQNLQPQMVEWRRDLHAHPELGTHYIRNAKLGGAQRPLRDHATSGNRDNNLSKVIGYSRTRMPVALWIALAMAAPTPHRPSSPTPLAFIGDEIGSVSSRKITS